MNESGRTKGEKEACRDLADQHNLTSHSGTRSDKEAINQEKW
jgi:hypothetical protein